MTKHQPHCQHDKVAYSTNPVSHPPCTCVPRKDNPEMSSNYIGADNFLQALNVCVESVAEKAVEAGSIAKGSSIIYLDARPDLVFQYQLRMKFEDVNGKRYITPPVVFDPTALKKDALPIFFRENTVFLDQVMALRVERDRAVKALNHAKSKMCRLEKTVETQSHQIKFLTRIIVTVVLIIGCSSVMGAVFK